MLCRGGGLLSPLQPPSYAYVYSAIEEAWLEQLEGRWGNKASFSDRQHDSLGRQEKAFVVLTELQQNSDYPD